MISKFAVAALLSVSLLHADAQLPYQKESQTSFQNEVLGQKSPFSEIKIHGKTAGYLEKIDENTVNINDIFSVDLRSDERFLAALDNSIQFYAGILDTEESFKYGEESYTPTQMFHSLILFRKLAAENVSYEQFLSNLQMHFDVYLTRSENKDSKLTGYYTPEVKASITKNGIFNHPLYLTKPSIKVSKPDFYVQSRDEIRKLEMEGAGILSFDDGKTLNIQYGGRKTVLDSILAKKKSVKKVVMKNGKKKVVIAKVKPKKETKAVFYISTKGPLGALSTQLIPGYTAAMDMSVTPVGSLVYVKSGKYTDEVFSQNGNMDAIYKKPTFESFMLAQDTGGAIKGVGRVDIYCGEGNAAKNCTYDVSSRGSVYLIVAKKDRLKEFFTDN